MTKNLSLMLTVGAALVLGLSSANDAQARLFGGGGSSGSSGSHGGFFSGGGSNGSHGGLFSRRSHGSNGGYSNGCGSSDDCGCGCGASDDSGDHDGDEHKSMNPPAAPKDPGNVRQAPAGGGASAVLEPTTAAKEERAAMSAPEPVRVTRVLRR